MKSKQYATLFALHLSLLLMACGPTPGPNTPSTASPTPSSPMTLSTPTPGPIPSPTTSGGTPLPTTPAPTANPSAASSTTVTLPNGSKLVISLGNRFLEVKGQTIQLQASLVDAAGQPVPLSTLKLLFSSSRPQDIKVDDTGLITALVEQGFADITVRVDGTEIKASQLVSVNSAETFSGGGGGGGAPQPTATPLEDLDVDVEFEGLGVGEFQVNTYTIHNQQNAAVAMDSDGGFVVTWNSYLQNGLAYGIYAQRYNSAGVAQGPEFRVNTYTTDFQRLPVIAMDSDGDFVISWPRLSSGGASESIYAQRYNSAGVAQDSEFRVNTYTTNAQNQPSVAMDSDGDFVVSWTSKHQDGSYYGVSAQRYNSAGTVQGSEFQVNTYTTGSQRLPAIAMDSDGDFVVSWESEQDGSGEGIYAQRYNSAGVAQGPEFRVNTYTTDYQRLPVIAMDSDGDFVITWHSYGQDGSNDGVYAQRYNSVGVAQGSEFRVNTYTTNAQNQPSVAMDSDGDFIVSWSSNGQDGSVNGVYAQRYNSAGVAQGPEFRVNSYTTDTQSNPAIAMDSDGDYALVWQSYGPDGSAYGIYAKRYNAAGQPQ